MNQQIKSGKMWKRKIGYQNKKNKIDELIKQIYLSVDK